MIRQHGLDIPSLWREYKKTEDVTLRNKLLKEYLHIVRYNAIKIKRKCPGYVELDDLVSAGVFGLMDAIKAFNPDRGVKFETYCVQRIRGAILDELRTTDWVPRHVRVKAKKTNTTVVQVYRITNDFRGFEKDQSHDYFVDSSYIIDHKTPKPDEKISKEDHFQYLISCLTINEKKILNLYYKDGYKMPEIGKMLDLTRSRVSQIRSTAVEKIKKHIKCKAKKMSSTSQQYFNKTG
jgi:RNA polymerase sigma factor for flagellar operon FliA